ncbi:MAG: hypothetical protein ACOYMV_13645 [Verrucomicrobiia bacterium]
MTFTLGASDMELLDADMRRVVEPGAFEVRVGPLKATFEVGR